MTEQEMKAFEAEVSQNPEMSREFEFQQEIIETIKEYRKAELKAHLDTIPVGGGLALTAATKIASSIVIVAGIGIGSYFIFGDKDPSQTTENIVPPTTEEIPTENEPIPVDQTESEEIAEEPVEEQVSEEQTPTTESSTPAETEEVVANNPTPVTPDVIESFEDEESQDSTMEIPENELENAGRMRGSQFEVSIASYGNYDFHYRFDQGKLFLFGDIFKEETYEILEIKSKPELGLFLYFQDKYYEVERDQKIVTKLEEIDDDEVLRMLNELKEN